MMSAIRTQDACAPALQTKKAARVSPPPCRCSSLSVFRDTQLKNECPRFSRKLNGLFFDAQRQQTDPSETQSMIVNLTD
jgi:hypothetical protein